MIVFLPAENFSKNSQQGSPGRIGETLSLAFMHKNDAPVTKRWK